MPLAVVALFGLFVAIEILATLVIRAGPQRQVNRWFVAFVTSLGFWILGIAALNAGWAPDAWGRLTFASASLLPATFLAFTTIYPRRHEFPPSSVVTIAMGIALLFATLSLATNLVLQDVAIGPQGLRRTAGPLYPAFAIYFLAGWLGGLGIFVTKWRTSRGLERVQLQFLGIGLLVATVGGVSSNLLVPLMTGDSSYAMFGPYSVLPLVLLVGHAIVRHRLLDLRLVVGRGVAFAGFIAVASAVLLALFELSDIRWDAGRNPVPMRAMVILFVVGLSMSAPIAPRLSHLIDRYLLRERTDLDRALRDAATQLARLLTPSSLAKALERILNDSLAPEFVSVLTRPLGGSLSGEPSKWDTTGHRLVDNVVQAAWRLSKVPPEVRVVAGRANAAWRSSSDEAVLDANNVEISVGLGRGNHILAVVLLGSRRTGQAYLASAIDFLEELALIASTVLETAYLHHQQLMLERDRERLAYIARLGRASATLAHEIRTPLATISNFVAMLNDRIDDPEYRDMMVRLVPAEVARIVNLTERLEALKSDESGDMALIDLGIFLRETASLLSASAEHREQSLEVHVAASLPRIRGYPDRLRQLFQNLIKNAMDATPPRGRIVLSVSQRDDSVIVEVMDEGSGLSPELRDSPFEAFVSTKPRGLGLGLSICQEVAGEHGARLSLENRRDAAGAIAQAVFPLPKVKSPTDEPEWDPARIA